MFGELFRFDGGVLNLDFFVAAAEFLFDFGGADGDAVGDELAESFEQHLIAQEFFELADAHSSGAHLDFGGVTVFEPSVTGKDGGENLLDAIGPTVPLIRARERVRTHLVGGAAVEVALFYAAAEHEHRAAVGEVAVHAVVFEFGHDVGLGDLAFDDGAGAAFDHHVAGEFAGQDDHRAVEEAALFEV